MKNFLILLFAATMGAICPVLGEPIIAEVASQSKELKIMQATGTFEVKTTLESQTAAVDDLYPTARFALEKTFAGGLQGNAIGVMLTVGSPKPGEMAAYVAVDQFTGTVNGKKGSFALTHRASMSKQGTAVLEILVVPESGRGELEGIAGSLAIDARKGVHHYDFSYSFPKPTG